MDSSLHLFLIELLNQTRKMFIAIPWKVSSSDYYIPNFSTVLPCGVQKWNEHQQPGSAESKDGRGKGWWEGISSQMEVALGSTAFAPINSNQIRNIR